MELIECEIRSEGKEGLSLVWGGEENSIKDDDDPHGVCNDKFLVFCFFFF